MEVPPEVSEIAQRLLTKPPIHDLTPTRVVSELSHAEVYHGCNIAFWRTEKSRYLYIYRLDRFPNNEEVMPWLQELFTDGNIQEASDPKTPFRAFFQGEVYEIGTALEMMADGVANAADKDNNADVFDFDKTELGKKLLRGNRNGTG